MALGLLAYSCVRRLGLVISFAISFVVPRVDSISCYYYTWTTSSLCIANKSFPSLL